MFGTESASDMEACSKSAIVYKNKHSNPVAHSDCSIIYFFEEEEIFYITRYKEGLKGLDFKIKSK